MTDEQPQFVYWATVLDFDSTILQFVFSIRSDDFRIYVQCPTKLMFRDVPALDETLPDVVHHFWSGCFVARKAKRLFSAVVRADLLTSLTSQTPAVTPSSNTDFLLAGAVLPEDLSVWCSSWGVWWHHAVLLKINQKILGVWLMLQLCSFLCPEVDTIFH